MKYRVSIRTSHNLFRIETFFALSLIGAEAMAKALGTVLKIVPMEKR